jgi:hypothetical protein
VIQAGKKGEGKIMKKPKDWCVWVNLGTRKPGGWVIAATLSPTCECWTNSKERAYELMMDMKDNAACLLGSKDFKVLPAGRKPKGAK